MSININFSVVGFGKIFKDSNNLQTTTPNKDLIIKISDILSQVKLPIGDPVSFSSIPEFVGIEYVGYIIDKERFDPATHQWVKIDEYKIVGSKTNVFRDTRITYGYSYRYKIKSVVKLTIKRAKVDLSMFSSQQQLQQYIDSKVSQNLVANQSLLKQIQIEGNNGIELKTSSGVEQKSIKISDNIMAVLNEDNTIKTIDVLGNTVDFRNGFMSDEEFARSINNVIGLQQNIQQEFEYVSFYYESFPSKTWSVVDILDLTPPPYPQTIKIFPNSYKKEIMISWLKPASEVEVKYFNVYRREKLGQPWNIVSEGLQEFETLVLDQDVEFNKKYIYAISSINVHGIESFLSTQIQVELNPNIVVEKKEKDLVWVSGGGITIDEVELVLKKFYQRKEQLVAIKNIVLYPNTKFREESKDFIIKIKSLDTHEQQELKVTLRNEILQE